MVSKQSAHSMKNRTPNVYGAGFVALDLLLSADRQDVAAYVGGTCGNVLTILSYLGWEAFPITRIGVDAAAEALRGDLRRWKVRQDYLLEEDSFVTPIVVQQNRRLKNGECSHRFIWQCPSCGKYLPTFRPVTKKAASQLLNENKSIEIFFFDRVAPATLALAHASAERGAVVVFEPSSIGDERQFKKALALAHVVKYSADRIARLRLTKDERPYLQIETLGKDGLRYRFKGGRPVKIPGFKIDTIADTSGAGDWCTAGLLSKLARNGQFALPDDEKSVRDALKFGQALAAINCRYEGARGAMYRLSAKQLLSKAADLIKNDIISSVKLNPLVQQVYTAAHCQACWPG